MLICGSGDISVSHIRKSARASSFHLWNKISLTTLLHRNFHMDEEEYENVCSSARARNLTKGKNETG